VLLLYRSYSGLPVEYVGHDANKRFALEQNYSTIRRGDEQIRHADLEAVGHFVPVTTYHFHRLDDFSLEV
jgi:hypothetical protein